MFLRRLRRHANIVKLQNVLRAENDKDIYLVFEYMGGSPPPLTLFVFEDHRLLSCCHLSPFLLLVWCSYASHSFLGAHLCMSYPCSSSYAVCVFLTLPSSFDVMTETDLHAVLRAKILQDIHKQYVIYQLLKSLKYLHSGELLHRDIKPSNLLLNSECLMKLADFGLARSVSSLKTGSGPNPILTDYVATRWYRAPEILLGSNRSAASFVLICPSVCLSCSFFFFMCSDDSPASPHPPQIYQSS